MSGVNRTYMVRVTKEVQKLQTDLPPEITCWPEDENQLDKFRAVMKGPPDSPYAGGKFTLSLNLTSRYPHEPPKVNFITRIHHPNIDDNGRICLDILKSPPKGTWKSGFNMISTLMSIYLLLSNPNPDDPLDIDVATQFKNDRILFNHTAEALTKKYATGEDSSANVNIAKEAEKSNGASSEGTKNSKVNSPNTKPDLPKAPTRPQLKLKSLSLKKGLNKEKAPSSSVTIGPKTPITKIIQVCPAASSNILNNTPSKGDLSKNYPKPKSMDKIIKSSGVASQASSSPVLEPESPATLPKVVPVKSKVTSEKKEGTPGQRLASSSKKVDLTKSDKDLLPKKRTLTGQDHVGVARKLKKAEHSTKPPTKKAIEGQTEPLDQKGRDSNDAYLLKKSADVCDIQLDLSMKSNGLVAKLTLSQSETISSAPKLDLKSNDKSPSNTSPVNSSLLQAFLSSTPPDLPSKANRAPISRKAEPKFTPSSSSYFATSTPASPKMATGCGTAKAASDFDLTSSKELPVVPLKKSDEQNIEAYRKRGWRPSPLEESIKPGSLAATTLAQRRPTFSLKKMKQNTD